MAPPLTVQAPPRISPATFRAVLERAGSPAAPEADRLYPLFLEAGVDPAGALAFFDQIEIELRSTMLLCGARNLRALRQAPRLVTGELRDWLALDD